MVGCPSVGKSTLINQITNADSEVGAYEFTTLEIIPGMLKHKGANLQVLDVPGIILGASQGKGEGRKILSVVRNADLILIIADINKPEKVDEIKKELYKAGLRLDTKPKDIKIIKKEGGGLNITVTAKGTLKEDYIKTLVMEYGVHNADIIVRQKVTEDEFIDVLAGNRHYVQTITVYNKGDII